MRRPHFLGSRTCVHRRLRNISRPQTVTESVTKLDEATRATREAVEEAQLALKEAVREADRRERP